VSALPTDLLDLIETLQASLDEEWFGFVSDDIDEILEQSSGHRAQLLALRAIVYKLGPATPMLANSTCADIDRVEEAIEMYLRTVFDA
jgi:hypothetical protein